MLLTASQDFAIHGPNKLLSKSHDHWKLSNWGFPALSSDPYFQTGFEIGFGNLSNRGSGFEIGFGNLSNRGSTWSHHLETSVKPLPKFPVAHQKWGGSLQKWPGCTQVWLGPKSSPYSTIQTMHEYNFSKFFVNRYSLFGRSKILTRKIGKRHNYALFEFWKVFGSTSEMEHSL